MSVVLLITALMVLAWVTPALAVTTATVCLHDSTGAGIPGAEAEFRSGSWQTIGLTAADGCVSTEMPAASGNRAFRVIYNGQTRQKTQDTSINRVVTFQTISVSGQLLDSTGTGIESALIQYNAGGWKTLGTTDANGQTSTEMFAASRAFRVTYNGQTQQKTQDTSINPVVTFQTGRVLQGTGPRVLRYQASGWRTFSDGIELLPGNVTFDLDVGPNEAHSAMAGTSIYVPIAPTSPFIIVGPNLTTNEGEEIAVSWSYTDVEVIQTHTATIDWGDGGLVEVGTVVAGNGLGGVVEGSHLYADDGSHTVVMCVTDDGSPVASTCAGLQVTVVNAAPVVTILGVPGSVGAGTEVSLSADVADPGTADTFTYAWSVTLDGEDVAGGSDPTIIFTPTTAGEHVLGLTVGDDDGGYGSTQALITVIELGELEEPPVEPIADPPIEPVIAPATDPQVEEPGKPENESTASGPSTESNKTAAVEPETQGRDDTSSGGEVYVAAQGAQDRFSTAIRSSGETATVTDSTDSVQGGSEVLALDISAELVDKQGAAHAPGATRELDPQLLVIAGLIATLVGVLMGRRLLEER